MTSPSLLFFSAIGFSRRNIPLPPQHHRTRSTFSFFFPPPPISREGNPPIIINRFFQSHYRLPDCVFSVFHLSVWYVFARWGFFPPGPPFFKDRPLNFPSFVVTHPNPSVLALRSGSDIHRNIPSSSVRFMHRVVFLFLLYKRLSFPCVPRFFLRVLPPSFILIYHPERSSFKFLFFPICLFPFRSFQLSPFPGWVAPIFSGPLPHSKFFFRAQRQTHFSDPVTFLFVLRSPSPFFVPRTHL